MINMTKRRRLLATALSAFTLFTVQSCLLGDGGGGNNGTPYVGRGYYAVSFATTGANPWPTARLNLDSAYYIRWNRADSITTTAVRIQLYKGDTLVLTLNNSWSAPGDTGSYLWSLVGSGPPQGSGTYRIKVTSVTYTSEWDYSPDFTVYSIYNGVITILAPTASTVAQIGTVTPITWQSVGNVGFGVG